MFKILSAALLALSLFVTGWYYLLTIKADYDPIEKIVYDFEPSCNDTTYLEIGTTFDQALFPREGAQSDPHHEYFVIRDGETLHSILRAKGVSEQEIAKLGFALKPHLLARDIAPNDHYWYELLEQDGNVMVTSFAIRKLDPYRVPIIYTAKRVNQDAVDAAFLVEIQQPVIDEEHASLKLVLKGTLYNTFSQLPFGAELMQRFMQIFAWKLRMPDDIAQGDEIDLLVKKKYVENELIGYGTILGASIKQKSTSHVAYYFESNDKKVKGFFDEHGKSLEKEFAYSPVFEGTATSDQKWRFHPVRKMRIRHNGIDYRGTIGTPFFSIADGEVVEKRFDKNVGNMIRIKHKYGVYSEYFHADSLNDQLSEGAVVRRGQKLGTIGRTGRLCTGPHLHMGLYKKQGEKRKFIELSSLRSILKPAAAISLTYMAEFNQHKASVIASLQDAHKPLLAGGEQ